MLIIGAAGYDLRQNSSGSHAFKKANPDQTGKIVFQQP
jgi:hypothetical protein